MREINQNNSEFIPNYIKSIGELNEGDKVRIYQTSQQPVGQQDGITGEVLETITTDPNPKLHQVKVRLDNGEVRTFQFPGIEKL
jgi:uncharacterized protein YwbE